METYSINETKTLSTTPNRSIQHSQCMTPSMGKITENKEIQLLIFTFYELEERERKSKKKKMDKLNW